jgi:hypothetical protein
MPFYNFDVTIITYKNILEAIMQIEYQFLYKNSQSWGENGNLNTQTLKFLEKYNSKAQNKNM